MATLEDIRAELLRRQQAESGMPPALPDEQDPLEAMRERIRAQIERRQSEQAAITAPESSLRPIARGEEVPEPEQVAAPAPPPAPPTAPAQTEPPSRINEFDTTGIDSFDKAPEPAFDPDRVKQPIDDIVKRIIIGAGEIPAGIVAAGASRELNPSWAESEFLSFEAERAKNRQAELDFANSLLESGNDPSGKPLTESQIEELQNSKETIERLLAESQSVIKAISPRSDVDLQDTASFEAADQIRDALVEAVGAPDEQFDDRFVSKLSSGAGSMAGFIAITMLTGGIGGAAAGSAMNYEGQYRRAIAEGATEEQARLSARVGAIMGSSEAIPITRALDALPPRLRVQTTGKLSKFLADVLQSAGEEGLQEALITFGNNVSDSLIYSEDRGWGDDVLEAAIIGAILGGGLGAGASAPNLAGRSQEQINNDAAAALMDQLIEGARFEQSPTEVAMDRFNPDRAQYTTGRPAAGTPVIINDGPMPDRGVFDAGPNDGAAGRVSPDQSGVPEGMVRVILTDGRTELLGRDLLAITSDEQHDAVAREQAEADLDLFKQELEIATQNGEPQSRIEKLQAQIERAETRIEDIDSPIKTQTVIDGRAAAGFEGGEGAVGQPQAADTAPPATPAPDADTAPPSPAQGQPDPALFSDAAYLLSPDWGATPDMIADMSAAERAMDVAEAKDLGVQPLTEAEVRTAMADVLGAQDAPAAPADPAADPRPGLAPVSQRGQVTEAPATSWIVIDRETGDAVTELFDPQQVGALAPRFQAVDAGEYLARINAAVKQNGGTEQGLDLNAVRRELVRLATPEAPAAAPQAEGQTRPGLTPVSQRPTQGATVNADVADQGSNQADAGVGPVDQAGSQAAAADVDIGGQRPARTPGISPDGTTVSDDNSPGQLDGALGEQDASIVMLKPSTIEADPERFQFKSGGDTAGVTGTLSQTRRWDNNASGVALVWQDKSGKLFIVDGHQRLGLAKGFEAQGQSDVRLRAIVLREADGVTAEDAMFRGAIKNLQEGGESTSAVDVAKVIRRGGVGADIEAVIPPTRKSYKDGTALASLGDEAFGMVINDVVPANYAAEVGRLIKGDAEQVAALKYMSERPPANANEARLVAMQMRAEGFATDTQTDMFGDTQVATPLFTERAKILNNAMTYLKSLGKVFKTAINSEAVLAEAGNVLDADANAKNLTENQRLAFALEQLSSRKGEVSDALTEQAGRLARGEVTPAKAREAFLQAVREIDAGASQGRVGERGKDSGDGKAAQDREVLAGASQESAPEITTEQTPEGEQAVIPGAERSDSQRAAQIADRQRGEVDAKAQQSKMRGDNTGDSGPLFDDQKPLFARRAPAGSRAEALQRVLPEVAFARRAPFFSPTLVAAEKLTQNKATGPEWLAQLGKQPGVKPEELNWIGLPDFLGDRKGVTKEELVAYIRENQVDVREVVKERGGGDPNNVRPSEAVIARHQAEWDRLSEEISTIRNEVEGIEYSDRYEAVKMDARTALKDNDYLGFNTFQETISAIRRNEDVPGVSWDKVWDVTDAADIAAVNKYLTRSEEVRRLRSKLDVADDAREALHRQMIAETIEEGGLPGKAQYRAWRSPGDSANYGELLLTLPPVAPKFGVFMGGSRILPREYDTAAEASEAGEALGLEGRVTVRELDSKERDKGIYFSGHWSETNVLAHIRHDTRRMPDGRNVLFIQEIQSDWHQDGRKSGYEGQDGPINDAKKELQKQLEAIGITTDPDDVNGQMILEVVAPDYDPLPSTIGANAEAPQHPALDAFDRYFEVTSGSGLMVPDAPLKKTWHETAFRRAVAWAVEKGYDSVTWATGEMNADVFGLEKEISRITWTPSEGDKGRLTAFDNNRNISLAEITDHAGVANLIGKELSQRLIDAPIKEPFGFKELTGLDLKVGGEGMKGFYDKIIPAYASKFGKKFGAEVGKVSLFEGQGDVWHMPITPQMRESIASQGVPLFLGRSAQAEAAPGVNQFEVTEGWQRAAVRIEGELNARAQKLGVTGIQLNLVQALDGKMEDGTQFTADGMFWQGTITVALDSEFGGRGAMATFNHEVIHGFRSESLWGKEYGLFRKAEWDTLRRAALADKEQMAKVKRDYPDLTAEQQIEEAIANMFGDWAAGRTEVGGFIKAAFERIRDFLKGLGRVLKAEGFDTSETVFKRIERGAVGRRAGVEAGMTAVEAQFSTGAKPDGKAVSTAIDGFNKARVALDRTKDVPNLKTFMAGIKAMAEAREKAAKDLAAMDGPLALKNSNDIGVLVTRRPDGEDGWRLTYFDSRGFVGDRSFPSKEAAIADALSEGYTDHAPSHLKNMMGGESWSDGARFARRRTFSDDAIQKVQDANTAAGYVPPPPPGAPSSFETPTRGVFDPVTERLQDRFVILKKAQIAIEAARGGPLAESVDAYLAQSLYDSRTAHQLGNFLKGDVAAITKAMKDEGVSLDDMGIYLIAKHAGERNAIMAQRDPARFGADGGSGLMNAAASQLLADYTAQGKTPGLEKVAKLVRKVIAQDLDRRLKAGLITQAQHDEWSTMYQFYVPLRGAAEREDGAGQMGRIGRGFDIRGKEAKAALGRMSLSENPLVQAIQMAQEGITRAEKNRVGKTLLRLVRQSPNPEMWRVLDKVPTKKVLDPATGLMKEVNDLMALNRDDVVAVKVGGSTTYIQIVDPVLAQSLKNLGVGATTTIAQASDALVKSLRNVTRAFSRLNTSGNPDFVLPNMQSDYLEGILTAFNVTDKKGMVRAFIKNHPGALRAAAMFEMGQPAGGKWDALMEEWKEAGGMINFMAFRDLEEISGDIDAAISGKSLGKKIISAPNEALKFIEKINQPFESAQRLAMYAAARERGYSKAKAAAMALDASGNYTRRGVWTQQASALYAFFNPAVQGIEKFVRFTKNPKTLAVIASVPVLAFTNAMLAMTYGDDDDPEGRPLYLQISEWDRSRSIIIPWGVKVDENGRKRLQYTPIRIPHNLRPLWTLGAEMAALTRGYTTPEKMGKAVLSAIGQNFNPLGSDSLPNAIAPTAIDPIVDLYTNRTWTGTPIVPQSDFGESGAPRSNTFFEGRTPEMFVQAAQGINSLTGGGRFEAGKVDIYPNQMQYLVDYMSGGFGRFVTRSIESAQDAYAGISRPPEQTPVVRMFKGQTSWQAEQRRYYDLRTEVQREQSAMRTAVRAYERAVGRGEDDAEAYEVIQRYEVELGARYTFGKNIDWKNSLARPFTEADKEIKELRTELYDMRLNKSLTRAQRDTEARRIEGEMEKLMRGARSDFTEINAFLSMISP